MDKKTKNKIKTLDGLHRYNRVMIDNIDNVFNLKI